jgi:shikimate 5-dehydrogenase
MTVDGVAITDDITIANGDVFYGNITAVTIGSGGSANAILLHKRGHGPTVVLS